MYPNNQNWTQWTWIDRSCSHQNYITDYSSGTEVCTDCGLVLKNEIYSWYNHPLSSSSFETKNKKNNKISFNLQAGLDVLYDVCSTYNIPSQICKQACSIFQDKKDQLKPSNVHSTAAFCLLEATKIFEVPSTYYEICCMFKIPTKDLLKKDKTLNSKEKLQIDTLKPSDLMPRIEFPCKMLYSKHVQIGKKADKLFYKVNSCPKTCLAYVIYEEFSKKSNQLKLSMKKCAELCNVSTSSIKRLKKKINA